MPGYRVTVDGTCEAINYPVCSSSINTFYDSTLTLITALTAPISLNFFITVSMNYGAVSNGCSTCNTGYTGYLVQNTSAEPMCVTSPYVALNSYAAGTSMIVNCSSYIDTIDGNNKALCSACSGTMIPTAD